MPIYTNVAGTWEEVVSPGLTTNVGGTWTDVTNGYVNVAGTWQEFYTKSDPVVYTFVPVSVESSTGFGTTWAASGAKVGSWDFGDRVTYYDFITSTDSGTGLTLAQALAIRPVVTDTTLKLYREIGGNGTMPSGDSWYFGANLGGYGSGTGTCDATGRKTRSMNFSWVTETFHTFTSMEALTPYLDDNELAITNNLTPVTSAGGQDDSYSVLSSTLADTVLTVTLDYV